MPAKKSTSKTTKKSHTASHSSPPLPVSSPPQPAPPTPTAPVTIPVTPSEDSASGAPVSVVHPPDSAAASPSSSPTPEGPSASLKEFASIPTSSIPVTAPITATASPQAAPSVDPVLPSSPDPSPTTPSSSTETTITPPTPPSAKRSWVWVILIILLVAGLVIAGFAVYSAVFSTQTTTSSESPSDQVPTSTPAPSPTPAAPVERSSLKVQVLNGSGVPGKAGEVKTLLESLGYVDVATGNADSYDYPQTEISVPDDRTDLLALLTADLGKDYTISDQAGALPSDSEYDVIVVVGQN